MKPIAAQSRNASACAGALFALSLFAGTGDLRAAEQPEPQVEVRQLKEDLAQVRKEYESRIRALEEALRRLEERQAAQEDLPAASPPPAVQASARGNEMNPRLSVIGDFITRYRDAGVAGEGRDLDFSLSGLEIGFQAEVDPYVRFDVFAAFHEHVHEEIIPLGGHDHGEEEEHEHAEGGLQAELEEAYITTLAFPVGLQLRAGRFLQKAGKVNLTHPHEQPWADLPTVNQAFLGPHGYTDDGFELNWLTPASFFWELSGAVTRGPTDSPTWGRSGGDRFVYLVHNKFFWDLSRATSLEFGQTWARGPASTDADNEWAEILGADLTLRWIPSTYREFTWQTEFFARNLPVPFEEEHHHEDGNHDAAGEDHDHPEEVLFRDMEDWGAYSFFQWRLAKRWLVGFRLDYVDYDGSFFEEGVDERWDLSPIAEFWPSEFQTLRFQLKRTWDDFLEDPLDTLYVNWVWVMGAHGAHDF